MIVTWLLIDICSLCENPQALYEAEAEALRERLILKLNETIPDFAESKMKDSDWESVIATSNPLIKGIVALCGLLLFFLSQRAMIVYGDLTKEKKRKFEVDEEEMDAADEQPAAVAQIKVDAADDDGKNVETAAAVESVAEAKNQVAPLKEVNKSCELKTSASCNDHLTGKYTRSSKICGNNNSMIS